ncbi:MAG: 8-amino-7-oxononanoate synthase [Lacipirellulaceae bacterium]
MPTLSWITESLRDLEEEDLLRELPLGLEVAKPRAGGLVNFASNDYLGLASDPRVVEAASAACRDQGVGRAASPLICGRSTLHEQLERELARFLNAEAALLFTSGYAANVGIIPALVDRGDCLYGDALNHASLIDGCRLARAERKVYRHGDIEQLEAMLQEGRNFRRRLIVSDTLFSMDGDLAPLPQLVRLAQKHDAMLLIDEAHALGVFGANGCGAWEHFRHEIPDDDSLPVVRIGTLSKAFGSAGGFVAGSQNLIHWLANRARSYVFSTAHPAANAAAALKSLEIVHSDRTAGTKLLSRAAELRASLVGQGWDVAPSASQIIPLRVGSAERAILLGKRLREAGYWVPAIRPPSVPEGQSLLRLSLTAAHTEEMISGLLAALGTKEPD